MSHILVAIFIVYLVLAIPLGFVAWALCRAAAKGDRRGEREVQRDREFELETQR